MQLHQRWQEREGALSMEVDCGDFVTAVDMVGRIAELAEEQNHHPDICINDYSRLKVWLRSHDAGTVTERDYRLAVAIDGII